MIGITHHYPHHPRRWEFLGNHRWLRICCARLKPSSTSRRTPERPNCWGSFTNRMVIYPIRIHGMTIEISQKNGDKVIYQGWITLWMVIYQWWFTQWMEKGGYKSKKNCWTTTSNTHRDFICKVYHLTSGADKDGNNRDTCDRIIS